MNITAITEQLRHKTTSIGSDMLNVIYRSMTCFWKNILVGSGSPIIQALDTALGLVVD